MGPKLDRTVHMQRRDAKAYLRSNACTFSYRLTIFWSNCSGSECSVNFDFKNSIQPFSSCYIRNYRRKNIRNDFKMHCAGMLTSLQGIVCVYTCSRTHLRVQNTFVICFFYLFGCLHIYLCYELFSYTVSSSNCIMSNGRMICD
jgi:hypothetical protein